MAKRSMIFSKYGFLFTRDQCIPSCFTGNIQRHNFSGLKPVVGPQNLKMTFDRSKAMRNAERFIAQGKIRSAIDEYKQVVRFDPRDYGTLNMLGDLHVKESDKNEAIRCYSQVAEYYAKQGFSQKAIAIYNKI